MAETLTTPETLPDPAPQAPWPGSHDMPRWNLGPLVDAPRFTWRNWFAMLGPGLLMGGSAIGGGEWLMGPAVTARYGGALMWLATLSILGQVVYNLEISRYTLYTGEPIFTGKFRTLPGPRFWLTAYLILDFGSVFPYLAANAATPLAAVILGKIPVATEHWTTLHFFGREYELTQADVDAGSGLCDLPAVAVAADLWRQDLQLAQGGDDVQDRHRVRLLDLSGDLLLDDVDLARDRLGLLPLRHGARATGRDDAVDNIFLSLLRGDGFPAIDLSTIGLLAAFAAIAGQGGPDQYAAEQLHARSGVGDGLSCRRDSQRHRGRNIALSHVGMVFDVTPESLPRWRRWYRHLMRDQLCVWMPACFIGLALPSMLSVQFLARGTRVDDWAAAGMTADGVRSHVSSSSPGGPSVGTAFWYMTLFCGFLVLAPSMASTIDGIVRRWVDVFWTSSPRLRQWDTRRIRNLYFYVLGAAIRYSG